MYGPDTQHLMVLASRAAVTHGASVLGVNLKLLSGMSGMMSRDAETKHCLQDLPVQTRFKSLC